ncbi:hypothetical protein BKP35_09545 [Anaerobacillus arseniciselenatis]|uniref:Dynamin N-terminal domain-containing protein n=1 Tax=Anaerobacillus arseniciselenatis TaxID=85682 RepID=A0A1S2LKS9_9BACI|nr:dynamin family protein [Anaerobacillus arseniciselenatis]OIJ12810.1 hypothetical protein BKP35_09545 [Anaerobacillus arseniciselenatis]
MIIEKLQSITENDLPYTKRELDRKQKLHNKKDIKLFEVAFCGHFSAGKSTLLNTIVGAEVLPTSPIPTSANIIEIKNGEQALSVHAKGEEEKVWHGEIPWNKVREWGMNGHDISKMTITAPLPFLGEHSCILDTPGVDSTDDSHEAITVEQLYTTDAIVYVMDYNHVQSETNLYFLKQLSVEKKPIYIVINQIDKHNETEIPFSQFKSSIETVFHSWGIDYISIYFTSMKNQTHPLNEFPRLEQHLKALLYQSRDLIEGSQLRLEQGFYETVVNRLEEEQQEAVSEVIAEMKAKGFRSEQLAEKEQLLRQLEATRQYDQRLWHRFDQELGKLFKNVTIFPALTTDLVREWIESLQPGFKVGVFFAKKKTTEEQERRLEKLINNLQNKVKSQLLFHVQAYFQKVDRVVLTNKDEFENAFTNLTYDVTSDLLKAHVNTDHSNREYVYTFTNEMTNMIVKDIRSKARQLVELTIEGMKDFYTHEEQALHEKLEKLKEIEYYRLKIERIENDYHEFIEVMTEQLKTFPPEQEYNKKIVEAMAGSYPENDSDAFANITFEEESVITSESIDETKRTAIYFSEEETELWLENVKNVLSEHKKTSTLAQERNHLLERINRYETQTFIVSLFGAFSAGKSSFANALLGEEVLPVSPNPTTATVSTVQKSTKDHSHKTAVVTLKSKRALNDEIKAVAEQLDEDIDIQKINHWNPNFKQVISSWQKTYAEYLLTIRNSLSESSGQLGNEFTVGLDELQGLVANESKACLIDHVEIYYDSPITNKGIVLVDTPGVNSIHGRHTNVAFTQMRTSDAIFYLTYYNHAFSKADQYFLQQIGKVNESFGHDKLYFVINASDLASSPGELNGVRKHVHDQLVKNGINEPRLYDLSSKEGLNAKKDDLTSETTFSQFESAFYDYTILELKQLSVDMITNDLKQYIRKIEDSITFMNEEKVTQQQKHERLKTTVALQVKRVNEVSFDYAVRDILQEFEQLVLYLRERMRFVLNDYFTTAINVSILTANSKKGLQEQLTAAIKEWRGLGEHFLKQELEATVIRMEEAIKERAKKWVKEEETIIQKELPFVYVDDEINLETTNVDVSDLHISVSSSKYASYIRSKKDFFEEGAAKQLKEVLVQDGVEMASVMIDECSKRYFVAFEAHFQAIESQLKKRIVDSIQNELERFEALFDPSVKESIQRECDELRRVGLLVRGDEAF